MSIEVKKLENLKYLCVKGNVRTIGLYSFFKKAFGKLETAVERTPDTKYFAKYNNVDWEGCQQKGFVSFVKMMFMKWDLEACVSYNEGDDLKGGLDKGEIAEQNSIQTIHIGPYHKVADTYNEILEYAWENKLQVSNSSYEFYLNDPAQVKAEELETLVVVPIG